MKTFLKLLMLSVVGFCVCTVFASDIYSCFYFIDKNEITNDGVVVDPYHQATSPGETVTFSVTEPEGTKFKQWGYSKILNYSYDTITWQETETSLKYKWTADSSDAYICADLEYIRFNVTFDGKGEDSGKMSALSGKIITDSFNLPTCTFKKTGHKFMGWKCKECTKTFTDGQAVTGSNFWYKSVNSTGFHGTLEAQWDPITYTVKFNGGGATSGSMNDMTCQYGQSYNLTPNAFKKTGHTFSEWKDDTADETTYKDKKEIKNLADSDGQVVTLTAQWNLETYDIIYKPGHGTPGDEYSAKKTYGVDTALEDAVYSLTNYAQVGWTEDVEDFDGVPDYGLKVSYTKDKAITLYPCWKLTGYTLTVDPNGGTFMGDSESRTLEGLFIGSANLNHIAPSENHPDHKEFLGYFDNDNIQVYDALGNNCKCKYWDDAYPNGKYQGPGNLMVRAHWGAMIPFYTISTEVSPTNTAGSASGGGEYEEGAPVTLTATANTGYSFKQWETNGVQVSTSAQYEFTATADTTYVAVFTGNVYEVSYWTGIIEPESVVAVTYGSKYGEQPIVHKKGYGFRGWYTSMGGKGDKIDSESIVTNAADHNLWAYWVKEVNPSDALDCDSLEFTIDGYGWRTAEDSTATNGTCLKIAESNWDSNNKVYTTLPENGVLRFNYKGGKDSKVYVKVGEGSKSYTFTCTTADTWYEGVITNDLESVVVAFTCQKADLWSCFALDYVVWTPKQAQQYSLKLTRGDHVEQIEYKLGDDDWQTTTVTCELTVDEGTMWRAKATAADGYKIDGETERSGTIVGDTNVVFKASEIGKYTITYRPGEGVSGDEYAQTNFVGTPTNLLGETYFAEGRGQDGWAKADGEEFYKLGEHYTSYESVELYPSWTNNQYVVTLVTNDEEMARKAVRFSEPYGEVADAPKVVPEGMRFAGWYNGGVDLIDSSSNVTNDFDHELVARFVKDCGTISDILDCTNLVFTTNGNCYVTEEFSKKGGSCVVIDGQRVKTYLQAEVNAPGRLTFHAKKLTNKSMVINVITNGENLVDLTLENDWTEFTVDVKSPAVIKIARKTAYSFAVDFVTWTPAAQPGPGREPSSDDKAVITKAAIKDGKFEIGFTSSAKFDYLLMTNGDLSVKSWGEQARIVGDGSPTNFTPVIDYTKPCLFYRVDTIQRK